MKLKRKDERKKVMKKSRILRTILKGSYFFVCFFVILGAYAYAYVDATSVTYIVQAIVGVFVAIGAVVTIQRHKIVAAYRKWHYGRIAKKNEKQGMKNKNEQDKESAD